MQQHKSRVSNLSSFKVWLSELRSSLKNLQETRASKVLLEAVKEKMDELQEALNQAGASKQ
eukprot:4218497-Amphidinium_carterae.1